MLTVTPSPPQNVPRGGGEIGETRGGLRDARHERLEGAHQLGLHAKGKARSEIL